MKRLSIVLSLSLFGLGGVATGQVPSSEIETSSFEPVTWERLVNAEEEPQNWLMYSGTFDSKRHSRLDQVHNRNVNRLELK